MRFWLFPLLLSVACATPPQRAGYVLTRVDELVVSNSPMMIERPAPVVREGRLQVPYVLLLLNRGQQAVTLRPQSISARMEYLPVAVSCRSLAEPTAPRELPLDVQPGMELRLECLLALSDEATRLAAEGDRVVKVRLATARHAVDFDYFLDAGKR